MGSAVVTGAAGPVRRRVEALQFDGAGAVINLGWPLPRPRDARGSARANLDATRRALELATASAATRFVHLSSATVYGAWADNPVPLTEEEPLRPNPGVADAVEHAEAERLVSLWKDEHPSCAVAILRPATLVGPEVDTWLSRALGGQPRLRSGAADPVRQFIHVEDLAGAAAHAAAAGLDGVFNVAADGWVAGDVVRGLSAARASVPLPAPLASTAARWAWSLHLSDLPPGLMSLIEHPWVVANDKLRASGWAPGYSNEEAVVAGRPGGWWREMSVAQRQQVALGALGTAAVAVAAGVGTAVWRRRAAATRAR